MPTSGSPRSTVISATSSLSQGIIADAMSSGATSDTGATAAAENSKLTSQPGESPAGSGAGASSGGGGGGGDGNNRVTAGGGAGGAPADGKDTSHSAAQQAGKSDKKEGRLSATPPAQSNYSTVQGGYPAHLTPQPGAGYYIGYQSQVTPEPPSPGAAAGAAASATVAYETFFQQPATFAPHSSPFGGTPLSPRRNGGNLGVIPPASPLFPRVGTASGGVAAPGSGAAGLVAAAPGLIEQQPLMDSSGAAHGHPAAAGASPSLSVPYLSPPLGPNMYQNYPMNGIGGSQSESPEDVTGWNDRNQQTAFQQGSPQINAQGIPVPYVPGVTRTGAAAAAAAAAGAGRSYSFEDSSMLPPSAVDQQEQVNPAYSPYTNNQNGTGAAGVGGTLFAQQQPWGYPGHAGADMYGNSGSPLQPRPTAQMPVYPTHPLGARGMQHMGLYGQYYPATSPGPPIQTTESNKGPDGANLFIFHIPNHFTNADMYQLFCPYGNLLSVRIMVEKDTGRSRGFGFVSYDSPASAALAIKELNGFAIGNKRLKVQHKQIRPSDQQHRDTSHGSYGMNTGSNAGGADGYQRTSSSYTSHLPPSGPMAVAQSNLPPTSPWYDTRRGAPQPGTAETGVVTSSQDRQELERGGANPENSVVETKSPVTDNAALSGGPPGSTTTTTTTTSTTNNSNNDSSSPGGVVGLSAGGTGNEGMSPLANLDPLRNALPDVPSNVSRNE